MKGNKKRILQIALGCLFFIPALFVKNTYLSLSLYVLSILSAGYAVFLSAIRNLFSGEIFDENLLMVIAAIGAFCIGEYPEAVSVMILYQVGETFQSYAVGRSRKSIQSLMDIRPDYANIEKDGEIIEADPYSLQIGDVFIVKSGERIPLDGVIESGATSIDTSALTGETKLKDAMEGDEVLSGSINLTGLIRVRATKVFEDSTASKILELVENASSKKSRSENFITSFARWYTPSVVILAILLAILPPIFLPGAVFSDWLYRSLTFLVISCPCALVISVPMTYFAGIGRASRLGVLVKGGNYLDALSKVKSIVFDKTGTLTKGVFKVEHVHAETISESEILSYAAHAESFSRHPIAEAIKKASETPVDTGCISSVSELPGLGVFAVIDGREVALGNQRLLESHNLPVPETSETGTTVFILIDGKYEGYITVNDEIKAEAASAITSLRELGVRNLVMLTGDKKKVGEKVASDLSLTKAVTELLPDDKVSEFENLLENAPKNTKTAFVGDGMNDAPVLARADVGIAMGSLGTDAAIEAADVVIMTDELTRIPDAISLSKSTGSIVKQNIIFALGVKFLVLALSAFGFASMWAAVFADVGVCVIAILNAMRLLKK
ncbi:MAG: cadmium-translocating P-type ATPase [Clostridiales bacterium]|nr:cadmium-translocating P-type ATPase [Clostridiales bacterium]